MSGSVTQPAQATTDLTTSLAVTLWRTALVAALFAGIVGVVMLVQRQLAKREDPLHSQPLAALQEQLRAEPKNQVLLEKIRVLDLQLRHRYFQQLFVHRSGAWLALGGVAILILASRQARRLRTPVWAFRAPFTEADLEQAAVRSRWSTAAVGLVFLLSGGTLVMMGPAPLAQRSNALAALLPAGDAAPAVAGDDFATMDELEQNWPRFLGALGNSFTAETNAPLVWDATSGTGIVWKVEVPVTGFNSPIVWRDRVLVSGGDAARREVYCYSAHQGALLWHRPVTVTGPGAAQAAEIPEHTGYAPSTMATDGRRVYVIFANGDLGALDLDGKVIWAKNLGVPKNPHGHAASLATWKGTVIVQLDQGESDEKLSKLSAFDGRTGRVLWQRPRAVPSSWATPVVLHSAGSAQIITLGVPWVISYAAQDGAELWRAEGLNNEVTPSPALSGGRVLVVSPNEKLMAVDPTGHGDVTKTHVVWSTEDNVPDISSPASDGQVVVTVSTPGVATCVDAKTGRKLWEKELGFECQSTPSVAAGRVYIFGIKGLALVVEAGPTYRELARNNLSEGVFASPAFVGGSIFVRGSKHLFRIGNEEKLASVAHDP